LILDLTANKKDYDHVVAVFKKDNLWGAISKTNRAALKYRDPVYKSIRELVMSYFNEYFLNNGEKTLRSYSLPFNLEKLDKYNWATSEEDIWIVPETLVNLKHIPIMENKQIRNLRKAEAIEVESGKIVKWKPSKNKAVKIEYEIDKNAKAEV